MAAKFIKVAIKVIRGAIPFVLACLLVLLSYIADWVAGKNIPGWDYIKFIVNLLPWLFLAPASVAMYVLAIVETTDSEYSRAGITAIAGTFFLGWLIILLILRRWAQAERRQAEAERRQAELAERSFRDEIVAPLPSEAGLLYDRITAASEIQPEVKNEAKMLVTIPAAIESGNITLQDARLLLGTHQWDSNYEVRELANVITHVINQSRPRLQ
ncbi:MAG: hypothetical protein ACM3ML_10430 [Micromonosporaceae bacterium]